MRKSLDVFSFQLNNLDVSPLKRDVQKASEASAEVQESQSGAEPRGPPPVEPTKATHVEDGGAVPLGPPPVEPTKATNVKDDAHRAVYKNKALCHHLLKNVVGQPTLQEDPSTLQEDSASRSEQVPPEGAQEQAQSRSEEVRREGAQEQAQSVFCLTEPQLGQESSEGTGSEFARSFLTRELTKLREAKAREEAGAANDEVPKVLLTRSGEEERKAEGPENDLRASPPHSHRSAADLRSEAEVLRLSARGHNHQGSADGESSSPAAGHQGSADGESSSPPADADVADDQLPVEDVAGENQMPLCLPVDHTVTVDVKGGLLGVAGAPAELTAAQLRMLISRDIGIPKADQRVMDCVSSLVGGAQLRNPHALGVVPLVQVEHTGALHVELRSRGLEDVHDADLAGRTILHHAALAGRVGLVGLALDEGANVNAVDLQGYSPLHLASLRGHEGLGRQLIRARADLKARLFQGLRGDTALSVAKAAGHDSVAEMLREAGVTL